MPGSETRAGESCRSNQAHPEGEARRLEMPHLLGQPRRHAVREPADQVPAARRQQRVTAEVGGGVGRHASCSRMRTRLDHRRLRVRVGRCPGNARIARMPSCRTPPGRVRGPIALARKDHELLRWTALKVARSP